jgi:PAS domain S-box-containing protein
MKLVINKSSLSKRCSFATIVVVALIFLIFCIVAIISSTLKINNELKDQVESVSNIAAASLKSALWNIERETIKDIIEALFKEQGVVYFRLVDSTGVINEKKAPEFDNKNFSFFVKSSQFITESSEIYYTGQKIGVIQLALSKKSYRRELMLNILSIVGLTLVIITAIFFTSIFITRRYIFRPLKKLEKSVTDIAQKNLEIEIDTSGKDEIGNLAKAIDGMRRSIKYSSEKSKEKEEKLEQDLNKSKAEFQKIEKKFNAVLNDIRKGVYWKDINGVIWGGNRFFLNYPGLTKPEELKKGMAESYAWTYKETSDIFRKLAEEAIDKDKPEYSERNSIIDNSGKQKWFNISCTPLKDITGKITDVLVTFEDITERVELEKRLEETNERLERTTTDINNLIHTFLHPVLKFYLQSEVLQQLGSILYKSIRCMTASGSDVKCPFGKCA